MVLRSILLKAIQLTAGFIFFSFLLVPQISLAATAKELNIEADATLAQLYDLVKGSKQLVKESKGVLVFPSVVKAGFGLGGEYGEGVLRIKGKTVDYYSTAAGSIGFQLGVQSKKIVIIFLSQEALTKFRASSGWQVGVDGSVALVNVGAGGDVNFRNISDPIVGFIFGQAGLMYNLTLEGSKFTKIDK